MNIRHWVITWLSQEYAKMTADGIRTLDHNELRTYKALKSRQSLSEERLETALDKDCCDFKAVYNRGLLRAWVRIPSAVILFIPGWFSLWLNVLCSFLLLELKRHVKHACFGLSSNLCRCSMVPGTRCTGATGYKSLWRTHCFFMYVYQILC